MPTSSTRTSTPEQRLRQILVLLPGDPGEPQDEKVWAAIGPSRRIFLDVVRDHLR
ncbi:hypothetical protein [Streptomyces sp. NPDC005573]|uniref:hypothetical protein n=1 Tax=Streptomyces sp. NPDC005573 TaxID=3156890 RepID=UPI0033B8B805